MTNNSITDESLFILKKAIADAIVSYELSYPTRSQSSHRQKNIHEIKQLCKDINDKETLLQQLENYFSSDDFYTGLWDRSALEDLIVDAVFNTDEDTRAGLSTFSHYKPTPQPSMHSTPLGAKDSGVTLKYDLNDFVDYAMNKYIEEHEGKIHTHRQLNIDRIQEILSSVDSTDKSNQIHAYVNSNEFLYPSNSLLRNYILTALDNYHQQRQRVVAIRTWDSLQVSVPPKIMIFLHGWHDSLNSGDQLARLAIKSGFTVIAYDQRGHGNDAERDTNDITSDLLRIDFRKFITHVQKNNPDAEIALVAHSLGGAILTTENKFINDNKSIKSVSLIAPAVMGSIAKMISPAKLFYRNMHDNVLSSQRASDRFGGKGFSLFALLNFIRKAALALKHLFASTTSDVSKWNIYSGKRDASVNYTEFEGLPQQQIKFFSRADHALHFGHRAGTVNRQIINDIEHRFSAIEHEKNDTDFLPK